MRIAASPVNRVTASESTAIRLHNRSVCVVASNAARHVIGACQKGDAMNPACDGHGAHGRSALIVLVAERTPRMCHPACPDAERECPRLVQGEGSAFRCRSSSKASAHSLRTCPTKGCQASPGLFRRKSLKTRTRPAKRVSRIYVEVSPFSLLSTRHSVPSRIRRNSQKTNGRRPRYSSLGRGHSEPCKRRKLPGAHNETC